MRSSSGRWSAPPSTRARCQTQTARTPWSCRPSRRRDRRRARGRRRRAPSPASARGGRPWRKSISARCQPAPRRGVVHRRVGARDLARLRVERVRALEDRARAVVVAVVEVGERGGVGGVGGELARLEEPGRRARRRPARASRRRRSRDDRAAPAPRAAPRLSPPRAALARARASAGARYCASSSFCRAASHALSPERRASSIERVIELAERAAAGGVQLGRVEPGGGGAAPARRRRSATRAARGGRGRARRARRRRRARRGRGASPRSCACARG